MLILISKIFALLLALLVVARSITDYKSKKESLLMTLLWIAIWLAIVSIAMFPELLQQTLHLFGGNRTGLGTIFGMAIIFSLFICYRVYVKSHRLEKQLKDMVKNSALEKLEKKTSKKAKKNK